jgi:hypothetical protein
MDVTHPVPIKFRFVVGGQDLNKYPAFNGQIQNLVYSLKDGAFVDNLDGLLKKLEDTKPFPVSGLDKKNAAILIDDPKGFTKGETKRE